MPRPKIEPIPFGVVYFTEFYAPIRVGIIKAADHWEACGIAWSEVHRSRSKIEDFQIIEDPGVIAAGPQHIRARAMAILEECIASRKVA